MGIFGDFQKLDLYCWYPEKQVGKNFYVKVMENLGTDMSIYTY